MVEFHTFDKSNLSDFATWKYTTKEELNPQKHGATTYFKDLAFSETYFPRRNVNIRKTVVLKLRHFVFKISSFPHLLVVSVSQMLLHLLWLSG